MTRPLTLSRLHFVIKYDIIVGYKKFFVVSPLICEGGRRLSGDSSQLPAWEENPKAGRQAARDQDTSERSRGGRRSVCAGLRADGQAGAQTLAQEHYRSHQLPYYSNAEVRTCRKKFVLPGKAPNIRRGTNVSRLREELPLQSPSRRGELTACPRSTERDGAECKL